MSAFVPSVSNLTWTLASRVPAESPWSAARYVVIPFRGEHD